MLTRDQKRNREAWRNLLYSGEYTQAKNALHSPSGHCCLGVACEIPGAPKWGSLTNNGELDAFSHPWRSWDGETLCESIAIPKFGISVRDQWSLAYVNDSEGLTFEEIADVLYLSEVSGQSVQDILMDIYKRDFNEP